MPEDSWARDVAQISRLVYRYAELIDNGDLEGLADLLADARFGTLEDPLLEGRDRILALYKRTVRIHEDGTPRTKHLVTNLVVEADGSEGSTVTEAAAKSYFTVLQGANPGSLAPIVAGRYQDRFENKGGVWRFSERRISTDLVGDVSAHMLPAAQHLVTGSEPSRDSGS